MQITVQLIAKIFSDIFFFLFPSYQVLDQVACYSLIFPLMRLQSIKFVLPAGCWPGESKSIVELVPLSLWTGLKILHFLNKRFQSYTAITWLLSSFLNQF
jgi:hypothetical protein